MNPKPKSKGAPPIANSVRMDLDKLNSLFDEMERRSPGGQPDPRRNHVRWTFRQLAVQVRVCHVAGSQASFHVACRNISSGGMSVLHSSFLHTGTKVIATLPHISGHAVEVEGVIARCVHVQGICHELGIKFRNSVDARNFVKLDLCGDGFILEKVDPATLEGVLIYIANSEAELTLIRHFLRDTKLRLRVADTFEEAAKLLGEPADLLIADYMVKGKNCAEFIASVREKGTTIPAIVFVPSTTDAIRHQLARAEVSSFLVTPLDQNMLFRALSEFMTGAEDLGSTVSALPRNHPNSPMVDQFTKEVHAQADEIEKLVKAADFEQTRTVVLQIAKEAPSMGFPRVAQIAHAADRALSSSMSLEESRPQLRHLVRACREVRGRAA